MKSIRDFADEIIIVDTSSDDTPLKIQKVADEEDLKISKFVHFDIPLNSYMCDAETYVYQSNLGLRYAMYRWVVFWDADYIAFTNGDNNILKLKQFLLDLDKNRYFLVQTKFIDLYGDFFHTVPGGIQVRLERFALTWAPFLRFYNGGRFECLDFPIYYHRIMFRDIHIVHLATVKKAKYLLYRRYWTDWREANDFQKFPTLQDYVAYRLKADYNILTESDGIKRVFKEHISKLIKCDYLLNDCPDVLKNEINRPRYRILYDNKGQLIGRNDIGIVK